MGAKCAGQGKRLSFQAEDDGLVHPRKGGRPGACMRFADPPDRPFEHGGPNDLVQYDDRDDLVATNLRFSWLQSANAGLYVVYNEIDEDGLRKPRREILLKYSRIIDLLR